MKNAKNKIKIHRAFLSYRRFYFAMLERCSEQSCKSGRAFRFEFEFGPGSGLKLTKTSGFVCVWDVLFVVGAQKYNQNNSATSLNFLDLT